MLVAFFQNDFAGRIEQLNVESFEAAAIAADENAFDVAGANQANLELRRHARSRNDELKCLLRGERWIIQCRRVDANGDGVLSFSEVMRHKLRALERGDKDKDGRLSFDEMVDIVRAEEEGAV